MISGLAYLWSVLLWGMQTDKVLYASLSTVEISMTIYFVGMWLLIYKPWRKK